MKKYATLLVIALSAPVAASSPAAWAALDTRSVANCAKASGLIKPQVGPAVRFSDGFGVDVREVDGIYPQKHMLKARAHMLCLVERKSGRVEISEKPAR